MSVLHLREAEACKLITMPEAIAAVEDVFRYLAQGEAQNVPRHRVRIPGAMLHSLSGAVAPLKYLGWKNYTTTRDQAKFHVSLYDQQGNWKAILEADWLGQLRTGAASGVATKFLANPKANSVGVIGCGKQARTQLFAMCGVRSISHASVFGRTEKKRLNFATEMSEELGIEVVPASSIPECVQDKEILITATTSREPVLTADLIQPGMHINAIGSNALNRAELSADCFQKFSEIVCDDLESCQREAGDFVEPLKNHSLDWNQIMPLSERVLASSSTKRAATEITLFKSVGMAIQDIAVAAIVYERALEQGCGRKLDI